MRRTLRIANLLISSTTKINWKTDTTNQTDYDDMMKLPEYFKDKKNRKFKIEWMSPDDYIQKVQDLFGSNPQSMEHRLDQKLVQKYIEDMQNGDRFPMLYLDYARKGQEGHHRATAAKALGADKIPVMIVEKVYESKY